MEIRFLNVGYGEAALIRQGGFTMLVDGGGNEDAEFSSGAGRARCLTHLKGLGIGRIDLMVSTHVHEDHVCGLLPVAREIPVGALWTPFLPALPDRDLPRAIAWDASSDKFLRALNDYRALICLLRERGVPIRVMRGREESAELTDGLFCDILGPDGIGAEATEKEIEALWNRADPRELLSSMDARMNNRSLILRLRFGGRAALFVGDTNRAGYGPLAAHPDALRAEVFKLGHHGQIDGIDEALLRGVAPEYVVFTASSDRRYGSAHPELIDLVRRVGATPLFTDNPYPAVPPHRALIIAAEESGIAYHYE